LRLDGLCRNSVSCFYRDQGIWRCLEQEVLPQLAAQALARGDTRLRVWSAGCAIGEETYTLALLFAFEKTAMRCEPQILATDADPHLLERAHRACYPATSLRDVPDSWRAAFEQSADGFCLKPEYRSPVRFLEHDVRRGYPADCYDLTLCRNPVFAYFETSLQVAIAKRLAGRLMPGGVLVLGIHESLPAPVPMPSTKRFWLCYRRIE
jgi:chemotaxis protein methyltransferase CheR